MQLDVLWRQASSKRILEYLVIDFLWCLVPQTSERDILNERTVLKD